VTENATAAPTEPTEPRRPGDGDTAPDPGITGVQRDAEAAVARMSEAEKNYAVLQTFRVLQRLRDTRL
jgi:hypothetical protein